MSALVLFITSQDARIFRFKPSGVEASHLKSHGHHTSESLGRNHPKAGGDADKFYHQVAEELKTDKQSKWLVVGPGLAHTHFQHHVQKHHPDLASCIVGCEPMENSTDGQIQAHARKFFKHQGLFESI